MIIRDLHDLADIEDACAFLNAIWKPDAGEALTMSTDLLRALAHTGNYVAAAYDGDRLVGASVGFMAGPPCDSLHSDLTGTEIGRGVGLALKLHQRQWALDRGVHRITWTFDPLIRRNAHFNVAKLGARPEEYLRSFYGSMKDAINGGDESDRLFMVWDLTVPHAEASAAALTPAPADAVYALRDVGGLPVLGSPSADATTLLVELPEDIETLRQTDLGAAKVWRFALREVLAGLLESGARVTGFHDKSCYVLQRDPRLMAGLMTIEEPS